MSHSRGPKSNPKRHNRATRRAARVADIPTHSLLEYVPINGALFINLDFCTSRSAAKEEEIFDALVEIIPEYADETDIIRPQRVFKPMCKDTEIVNKHDNLAQVVEYINDFSHVK